MFMNMAMNPVSIHAPVMGAKKTLEDKFDNLSVSIHAPVMGAKIIWVMAGMGI